MVFEYKVMTNRAAFLARVVEISAKLGINPDWLMVVMQMESDLSETASNPYTNATGLIQFMPATARGLGTTCEALASMTNVHQLDYVYSYFKPYAGRLTSVTDLYMVTFFPRGLGQPDSYVMQTDTITAAKIAGQNPGFDLNKNGEITAGEFKAAILKRVPGSVEIAAGAAADYVAKKLTASPLNTIVGGLILILTLYFIYTKTTKK